MALNVNRVTLGFNYNNYDTSYFSRVAKACPVSSTALADGSFLICKAGGMAWFVSPNSTQIGSTWGGSSAVSPWGSLSACLSARGYTPTQWFVPSIGQLQNPGYLCRDNWGFSGAIYWSSSDSSIRCASSLNFSTGGTGLAYKPFGYTVRASRCVTY